MKRKIIILSLLLSFLTSCSNKNIDEYISYGFNGYHGDNVYTPTAEIELGLKTKKEQSMKTTFEVYPGACFGFEERWYGEYKNKYNPGYGTFAINTIISDMNLNTIESTYTMLFDFPNDEKYAITYDDSQGIPDYYVPYFSTYILFYYDFSLLNIDSGYIGYYICYYDDINNKEFDIDSGVYDYGVNNGNAFKFKKNIDSNTVSLRKWYEEF